MCALPIFYFSRCSGIHFYYALPLACNNIE